MKQFWILFGVIVVTTAFGNPDEFTGRNLYSSRYDNLNIESILSSQRLVINYVDCLLNKKPCPPEGKELKKILPEALKSKCGRCSPRQKENALKIIRQLYEKYPNQYNALREKWDTTGEYHRRFEEYLSEEQFNNIHHGSSSNRIPSNNHPKPQTYPNNPVQQQKPVYTQVNQQPVYTQVVQQPVMTHQATSTERVVRPPQNMNRMTTTTERTIESTYSPKRSTQGPTTHHQQHHEPEPTPTVETHYMPPVSQGTVMQGIPTQIIDNYFVPPEITRPHRPIHGIITSLSKKAEIIAGMLRSTVRVFVGHRQQFN